MHIDKFSLRFKEIMLEKSKTISPKYNNNNNNKLKILVVATSKRKNK